MTPLKSQESTEIARSYQLPGGCPWDGEQTNRSLIKPLLEETYEYIDAVETGDRDNMREEQIADELLALVRRADAAGIDIEGALRNRLRQVEDAARAIE